MIMKRREIKKLAKRLRNGGTCSIGGLYFKAQRAVIDPCLECNLGVLCDSTVSTVCAALETNAHIEWYLECVTKFLHSKK